MKILQVIPVFSDSFGGPVTLARTISKELAKKHDITIYTTTASDHKHDFQPKIEEKDGYTIHYFPRTLRQLSYTNMLGELNLSYGMLQSVKKNLSDFDLAHVHSYEQFPDILINHYATKFGVPYFLQPHGSMATTGLNYRKMIYYTLFGSRVLRDAAKVIALTNTESMQIEAAGVPNQQIVVVPNSLDLESCSTPIQKGSFKKRYNIPENKSIVLFLGRIHKSKGIDLLVKAFSFLLLDIHVKDLLLVIAGPDEGSKDEIYSLINSLGISEHVLFTGFISDKIKAEALIDASVFVTPSFYGFPMTFLESCAMGTPIVTTTQTETLDWIDNNVGYSVKPTYVDLGQAINRILSNEETRQKLSENCKKYIRSNFSVEMIAHRLEEIYSSHIPK